MWAGFLQRVYTVSLSHLGGHCRPYCPCGSTDEKDRRDNGEPEGHRRRFRPEHFRSAQTHRRPSHEAQNCDPQQGRDHDEHRRYALAYDKGYRCQRLPRRGHLLPRWREKVKEATSACDWVDVGYDGRR